MFKFSIQTSIAPIVKLGAVLILYSLNHALFAAETSASLRAFMSKSSYQGKTPLIVKEERSDTNTAIREIISSEYTDTYNTYRGIKAWSVYFKPVPNPKLPEKSYGIEWHFEVKDDIFTGVLFQSYYHFQLIQPTIALPSISAFDIPVQSIVQEHSVSLARNVTFITRGIYPKRFSTVDGEGFDAVEIEMQAAEDWISTANMFLGYKLGLVALKPQKLVTVAGLSSTGVMLKSLPAPQIEGTVIEYRNTADFATAPGGHYFYTADVAEQTMLDAGGAGKFVRTGLSFKAGGYVRLCRFYGSQKPGPNSHFFTTDDTECKALQALQKTPTPSDTPQWNFENYAFGMNAIRLNADGTKTCPTGSIPVYRAYNKAFDSAGKKNAWDSNHRFSTDSAIIAEMVKTYGWVDEGAVLCAPQ